LEEANRKSLEITESYALKAEEAEKAANAEAQKEADRIITRARASMEAAKRRALLEEQVKIIDDVFEEAFESIRSLPEDKYCDFLVGVAAKVLTEQIEIEKKRLELCGEGENGATAEKYEIILNKKDRDSLGAALIEGLRRTVIGKIRKEDLDAVCISREIAEITGGFIIRFNDIEIDCSLSSIFAQVKEQLEMTVSRKLFS
jgi:V/A-type H+-transporting ATPase subunit E